MRYLFIIFLSFSIDAIELSPGDANASVYFIPHMMENLSQEQLPFDLG